MQDSGSHLATGSVDGSVYLLELSEGLVHMQPGEKQGISQMLDRESKREKNLEARAKELRNLAKKAEMEAKNKGDEEKGTPWAEEEKNVEEEFWKAIDELSKKDEAYAATE